MTDRSRVADASKSRPWWQEHTYLTALMPIVIGLGGFLAAQISWYEQNLTSEQLEKAKSLAQVAIERRDLATERGEFEEKQHAFRKEEHAREVQELKAKFESDSRKNAESLLTVKAEHDAYVTRSKMLLSDLQVATRLTELGASLLISHDEDVPKVTGVNLQAINLGAALNKEVADSSRILTSLFDAILKLNDFQTLVPPRPIEGRALLLGQLRRLNRFELDIATWELDGPLVAQFGQLRGLTGVAIHVKQLDAIRELTWLLAFSISMSDPYGNVITESDLAAFKDGRFPKTKRLVFKDLIQTLSPVWNLQDLQYLEIGDAWSGVGYTVTEADLAALSRLPELRTLIIHGIQPAAAKREQVTSALPKCRVEFRN